MSSLFWDMMFFRTESTLLRLKILRNVIVFFLVNVLDLSPFLNDFIFNFWHMSNGEIVILFLSDYLWLHCHAPLYSDDLHGVCIRFYISGFVHFLHCLWRQIFIVDLWLVFTFSSDFESTSLFLQTVMFLKILTVYTW